MCTNSHHIASTFNTTCIILCTSHTDDLLLSRSTGSGTSLQPCVACRGARAQGRPDAAVLGHHVLVSPAQRSLEEERCGGPHDALPTWTHTKRSPVHTQWVVSRIFEEGLLWYFVPTPTHPPPKKICLFWMKYVETKVMTNYADDGVDDSKGKGGLEIMIMLYV